MNPLFVVFLRKALPLSQLLQVIMDHNFNHVRAGSHFFSCDLINTLDKIRIKPESVINFIGHVGAVYTGIQ